MILQLKRILKEKNVTSIMLSEQLNVSKATISYWLNGKVFPTAEMLERIANILGVEVWELFYNGRNTSQSFVCPECGAELKLQITKA